MICIVDYEAGNLRSVQKAVEHSGVEAKVSSDPKEILDADKVIFPGVGAFGKAVEKLDQLGLRDTLLEFIDNGKPFLGICLGMQLLFEQSEENPGTRGLSVFKGDVKRFEKGLKVPHLGWNILIQKQQSPLWNNIPDKSFYYFAHSYYISPQNSEIIIGETEYGFNVPVAVHKENVFGLQFHPEKSQKMGLNVLKNFVLL